MIDHEAAKKLPQVEIFTQFHEADGLITKEMHIPAGIAMGKELHDYSHQSFLVKGRIKLHRDDSVEEMEAPRILNIKAGVWHAVEAVTDTIWYCTHNTDYAEHNEKLQPNS